MLALRQAIEEKGRVLSDSILKVDTFLNHQIDPVLMQQIGQAFARRFKEEGITKILTIETSGIPPAYATAVELNVPLIFAKKTQPGTMRDPLSTEVYSFTKQKPYTICLERGLLEPGDRVLFIDDFLANGEALKGAIRLTEGCGAQVVGVGIVIAKAFQKGPDWIRAQGLPYCPLASIRTFKDGRVIFEEDEKTG